MPPEAAADLVEWILADPPQVHPDAGEGVWRTDRDCYELIAEWTQPGSRTLETGCGVSTAVFAARGADHVCVVWTEDEKARLLRWAVDCGVDTSRLSFVIGPSQDELPRMEATPLEVVLIDGEHRFPLPVIDWFYTVTRLAVGGLYVLDDVQLPGPRLVADYLEATGGLRVVQRTPKWAAFELASALPPPETWKPERWGDPLIPRGPFEAAGSRLDGALRRLGRRLRRRR